MSDSACIILNPLAKGAQAQKIAAKLRFFFPQANLKIIQNLNDAQAFAADAVGQGTSLIIAAGGDGTINGVVNGMAGSKTTLGILPIGSMNVFAMELGIPLNIEKAVKVILHGKKKKVDLGCANGRRFVQLAGVGLDASVVQKTSSQSKNVFGPLSYILTLLQMGDYKPPKLVVSVPRRKDIHGALVLIGNGRLYGGPFKVFPRAKINDGKLDVCIFPKIGYLDIFYYLQGILLGTHLDFKGVTYFQTDQLYVSSSDSTLYEIDGELCGETPVQFSIQKRALNVIVP